MPKKAGTVNSNYLQVIIHAKSLQSCLTLETLQTVACQAPLSIGFFRQESWSGLPFPSPGDLPDPGIKPGSPALQADSYQLSHWGAVFWK